MAKLYNLARMSTATVGAGTITLGSAVSGYLTFALAGVANAEIVSYGIKDGSNSEVGTGTYTSAGTTLTRNVTASTNGNAAISLSGSAEVFITPRKEDLLYPSGYLFGLTLSTAGSSQVFSIAAGMCMDSTNLSIMVLPAFTKTAVGGGTWVVGTGNAVLDTGAYSTNTWYHVFVIQRLDTGLVDVLVSLSATSPTMPTNYTLFRRIGALRSGSVAGQWVLFHQLGDVFLWDTPPTDINTATLGTGATSFTLTVPGGVQVDATIAGYINVAGAGNAVQIWSPDATDLGSVFHAIASVSSVNFSFPPAPVRTNTSSQIKAKSTTTSTSLIVGTISWIDRRGRDA